MVGPGSESPCPILTASGFGVEGGPAWTQRPYLTWQAYPATVRQHRPPCTSLSSAVLYTVALPTQMVQVKHKSQTQKVGPLPDPKPHPDETVLCLPQSSCSWYEMWLSGWGLSGFLEALVHSQHRIEPEMEALLGGDEA